ncbi:MAG: LON peptidase substrate-binding domain-containing protein [Hyphomonadaceae bacterium]
MNAYGYRKPGDLPARIPLFPLAGAIVFPRGELPLNIFEPRYLNMVDDALRGDRVIGMIQPASDAPSMRAFASHDPPLAEVGAVGRITTFAETEDGRYLITLTGLCRFRLENEISAQTPYRQALVDYAPFAEDLKAPGRIRIDREKLRQALRRYVDTHGFQADWSAVDKAPTEALVNSVSALCPFDAPAKQALLEAQTISDRCAALIALLELGAAPDSPHGLQ